MIKLAGAAVGLLIGSVLDSRAVELRVGPLNCFDLDLVPPSWTPPPIQVGLFWFCFFWGELSFDPVFWCYFSLCYSLRLVVLSLLYVFSFLCSLVC